MLITSVLTVVLAADPVIWLSGAEIVLRPTTGAAYDNVVDAAGTIDTNILGSPSDDGATGALANALLYVRTGNALYKDAAIALIEAADGTECGHSSSPVRIHALKLGQLVEAAHLVGYSDVGFDAFLVAQLHNDCGNSRTLIEVMEQRPNNWGTTALTAVMSIALYLDDTILFDHSVDILHGWLGDTTAYNSFDYGNLCWQADESVPVGINPIGSVIDGVNVDGVLPDDQRRGPNCPPDPVIEENYVYSALAGPWVSCEIAHKKGHDAWGWEDEAMLRAAVRIETDFASGFVSGSATNDRWQGWVVNWQYGSGTVVTAAESTLSKSYAFTSWTMPTCRYDFDSDGMVGIVDYLLILDTKYYTINDFLSLLEAWGDCP